MAAHGDVELAATGGADESKQDSPRLAAVPPHHIERKQTWAGHGLHTAYEGNWGPIIHAVMGFDERVDRGRLEEVLARELVQYPRFASRVSADGKRWVPVKHLDLSKRVLEVTLPGVSPQAELQQYIGEVMGRRFDDDRPLWEVIMVSYATASYAADGAVGAADASRDAASDGDGDGKAQTAESAAQGAAGATHSRFDLLFRISHSIGDGITLATLLIDLCEPLGEAPPVRNRKRRGPPLWVTVLTVLLILVLVVVLPILFCVATGPEHDAWLGMDEPLEEWLRAVICVVWIGLVLCVWPPSRRCLMAYNKVSMLPISRADTTTALKGGRRKRNAGGMSDAKLFACSEHRPIRIAAAKQVAKWAARANGLQHVPTMNDVLLAALGGGIRRYLEHIKDPAVANDAALRMRAISIVNMRAATGLARGAAAMLEDVKAARWGNDFSYFLIPLPCNKQSSADRIETMSKTMSFIKASPEALFIREGNRTLYNCCGVNKVMQFNAHNLDKLECFMSNLAGPQMPLKFAGSRIQRLYNCTHPMEFGAGYSFLSYNGVATLCVSCDSVLVPNPSVLVDCVLDEYEAYEAAAGVAPAPKPALSAPPQPPAAASASTNEVAAPAQAASTGNVLVAVAN